MLACQTNDLQVFMERDRTYSVGTSLDLVFRSVCLLQITVINFLLGKCSLFITFCQSLKTPRGSTAILFQ